MQEADSAPAPRPPRSEAEAAAATSLDALRRIDRTLFDDVEPAPVFHAGPPEGAAEP